jgi:AcrR family transcriptional regulator
MGTNERRARAKDDVRRRILDAARELFAAEGYEAVTLRKIAAKIEYTPAAIYFHFADKETLIQALCDHDFLALAERMKKLARVADPIDRLRRIGLAYAAFALEHRNHYRVMFMTPHPDVDIEKSAIRKGDPDQDAYALLVATVREAIDAGRFRADLVDVELVAQTFWAVVHGVVSLRIAKDCDAWIEWRPVKKALEFAIDATLAGVLRTEG